MPLTTCPVPADLERLYLGGLSEKDIEALEQHAVSCGSCMAKLKKLLKTHDTLSGVLSENTVNDATPSSPAVEELIKKLETLRPTSKGSPQAGTSMIAFTCSACPKKLSVKVELAGKKVKCPACGKVMTVPTTQSAPPGIEEDRTVPPAVETDKPITRSPLSGLDATAGIDSDASDHETSLTDFLSPPQADDELGRLGKYRILKILGHGGMGVVYKAEDPKLMRTVALKAMLPALAASASAGKRFLREAQAMAAVEHDHIVRIYQVDEDRNVPYMAMEFLKGEPLDERLKRDEKMPLEEVLRIGREIAKGLDAAHKTGLIHRDIKPGNIWLEAPEGRVKILDFGLARAASQDSGLTQQGAIIGTPAYMAPEQGRGEAVDGRTDLFSLGVILYRLCSGQQPFRGNDTVSTIMDVALHEPPPPRALNVNIPPELSELVMKLLEKDPAKRIASAGQVVATLQVIEKKLQQGDTFAGTQPVPISPPPRRRPKVMVAVAALFAAAALAAGIVYFMQTPKGTIRIEIDDPNIEVTLTKTGASVKGVDKHDIKLEPGEHGFTVKRGDLEFQTDKFVLNKGETITLKVEWLKEGTLKVVQGGKVVGSKTAKETGTPNPTTGNYALELDDNASVPIDLTAGKGIIDFTQPFTIEAWANPSSATAIRPVIRSDAGLAFGITKGPTRTVGVWNVALGNPNRTTLRLYSPEPAKLNTFTRVAVTGDGKTVRLFVDGKLSDSGPLPNDLPPSLRTVKRFDLGGGRPPNKFVGLLDDVRFSTVCRHTADYTPGRPEKDAETVALYHCDEGTGDVLKDSSGNGHHGNIVGAKWVRGETTLPAATTVFNGKDFTGFSAGPHWKVWDGMFLGEAGGKSATLHMLKTQAEYTDYEASFRFKYPHDESNEGRGAPTFAFRKGSFGQTIVISFQRSRVTLSAKMGRKTAAPRENDFNEVWVRCQGKHTKVVVNGETLVDGEFDTEPTGALSWYTGEVGNVYLKDVRITDLTKSSATPLFNGKDLTGFSATKDTWKVEDGVLKGNIHGVLRTLDTFTDFELSFRHRNMEGEEKDQGSEFIFRSNSNPRQRGTIGFGSDRIAPSRTVFASSAKSVKPRENGFNDVWVRCVGKHVKIVVNDETLVDGEFDLAPSSIFQWGGSVNGTILKDIRVTDLSKPTATPHRSAEDDWLKEVAAMPAEKQVEAVVAKLKERNPGYDGKETHILSGNQEVRSLTILSDDITDVSPIRALTKLDQLVCRGTTWGAGTLVDLSPLKGMKLTQLDVQMTKVSDLSPLEGMKLTNLSIAGTEVSDLSVVKGMPLQQLGCHNTKVSDLSPIKNLQLDTLRFNSSKTPPIYSEPHLEVVRSIKSLTHINGKAAAEFWKEVDEKKP